jgi:hypothetical protein
MTVDGINMPEVKINVKKLLWETFA